MSENKQNKNEQAGKVDLRNVFIDASIDTGIDQYVLNRKKAGQRVKKGQAAVELIERGLKAEGIL